MPVRTQESVRAYIEGEGLRIFSKEPLPGTAARVRITGGKDIDLVFSGCRFHHICDKCPELKQGCRPVDNPAAAHGNAVITDLANLWRDGRKGLGLNLSQLLKLPESKRRLRPQWLPANPHPILRLNLPPGLKAIQR